MGFCQADVPALYGVDERTRLPRILRRRLEAWPIKLDHRLHFGRSPRCGRASEAHRVHVRSVEQPVDLDDGPDAFNYPWLYAVEVGHWQLTDFQVKQMREFLERGGFFMCDDFHGTQEWDVFLASMKRVFPDRPIVDIPDSDPIFHVIYDLDHRYQVPGAQYLRSGRTYEQDGYEARWRGIYDEHGGSWWRSATTWIWETRGSGRTIRGMTRSSRPLLSGSYRTTWSTR